MGLTQKLGTIPLAIQTDSSNNVGIGTSTIGGKLDVRAAATSAFSYYFRNAAGGYGGGVYNTGSNNTQLYLATSAGTENILLNSSGASYFNGGNVGIGTSSPSALLTLAKDNVIGINTTDGADNGYLALAGAGGDGDNRGGHIYLSGNERGADAGTAIIAAGSVGSIQFRTGASVERMRITSGGGLCLGYTTDAGYQLRMSGYLYVGGNIVVAGDGTIGGLAGTGNRAVYSNASGQLTNSSSDKTLKTNVTTISYGLDSILNLKPISFNWIDDEKMGTQTEIGFIAQEVQEIIPELIGINNDETLSLDYPKMVAVLTKAIQELSAKVTALENK